MEQVTKEKKNHKACMCKYTNRMKEPRDWAK